MHAAPPSITTHPVRTVQLLSPATLNLTCSADGLPLPTISWIRTLSNGSDTLFSMANTIESRRNITISTTNSNSTVQSTIVIEHTLVIDTANYSCMATNRLGASNSTLSFVSIYVKLYLFCISIYNKLYLFCIYIW